MLPSDAAAIPPDVQRSRDRAAELQRVLVDAYDVAYGTEWCVRPIGTYMPRVRLQPIEVTLWPLVRHACDAIQAWRGGERNASRVQYQCERSVATGIAIYEAATGRDAIDALRAVVERNRTRPMRHGHVEGVA